MSSPPVNEETVSVSSRLGELARKVEQRAKASIVERPSLDSFSGLLRALQAAVEETARVVTARTIQLLEKRLRNAFVSFGDYDVGDERDFRQASEQMLNATLRLLRSRSDIDALDSTWFHDALRLALGPVSQLYATSRFRAMRDGDLVSHPSSWPILARLFDQLSAALLDHADVTELPSCAPVTLNVLHMAMWYQSSGWTQRRLFTEPAFELVCRILANPHTDLATRFEAASAIIIDGPPDLLGFIRARPALLANVLDAVVELLEPDAIELGKPMIEKPSWQCGDHMVLVDPGLQRLVFVLLIPALLLSPSVKHDSSTVDLIQQAVRPTGLASALLDGCVRVLRFAQSRNSEERVLAATGSVHALAFLMLLCVFDRDDASLTATLVGSGLVEVFVGASSAAMFVNHACSHIPANLQTSEALMTAMGLTKERLIRLGQIDSSITKRLAPLCVPGYARIIGFSNGKYTEELDHPPDQYEAPTTCVCGARVNPAALGHGLAWWLRLRLDLNLGAEKTLQDIMSWPAVVACCHEGCGKPTSGASACAACSLPRYCSKECQKAAWPVHRPSCSLLRQWPLPPKADIELKERKLRLVGCGRDSIVYKREEPRGLASGPPF